MDSDCVLYYDSNLPNGIFTLIGFIIGLIAVLLLWFLYLKNKNFRPKKIHAQEEKDYVTRVYIDKTKLITDNYYPDSQKNDNPSNKFVFLSDFAKRQNFSIKFECTLQHLKTDELLASDEDILYEEIKAFSDLEFEYRNSRLLGHRFLARQVLNLLFAEKFINDKEYEQITKTFESNFQQTIENFNNQCENLVESIKQSAPKNSSDKDINLLILEKLPSKADTILNEAVNEQISELQYLLQTYQEEERIKKEEYDEILQMYSKSMRNLEEKLSQYKTEMQQNLDQRLANLQKAVKSNIIAKTDYYDERCNLFVEKALNKLTDTEKKEILNKYRKNLEEIERKNKEVFDDQMKILMEELKNRRIQEVDGLLRNREEMLNKSDEKYLKMTLDRSDIFVDEYVKLNSALNEDLRVMTQKMDANEFEKYNQLRNKYSQTINEDVEEMEYTLLTEKATSQGMDSDTVDEIMRKYKQSLRTVQQTISKDKQSQIAKMTELLRIKSEQAKIDQKAAFVGQMHEEEKQIAFFEKAINEEMQLPLEIKQKILEDSMINEIAIKNQMEATKIRQQKHMELLIAKQLQQIKQTEPAPTKNKIYRYEEVSHIFEEEKQKILLQYRDNLALETAEKLKEQEKYMCDLIAKYQIELARRLHRKKAISQLYDELVKKLNKPAYSSNPYATKQVVSKYENDKIHIEDMRNKYQDEQTRRLEEKLRERKVMTERLNEQELQRQFVDQLKTLKKQGVGEGALSLVESRMKDKLVEKKRGTEKELKQKFKDEEEGKELNYNNKIEKSLREKQNETLSRLAVLSDMSINELSELIDDIDPDIDETIKRKILAEIGKDLRKANRENAQYQFTDVGRDPRKSIRSNAPYAVDDADKSLSRSGRENSQIQFANSSKDFRKSNLENTQLYLNGFDKDVPKSGRQNTQNNPTNFDKDVRKSIRPSIQLELDTVDKDVPKSRGNTRFKNDDVGIDLSRTIRPESTPRQFTDNGRDFRSTRDDSQLYLNDFGRDAPRSGRENTQSRLTDFDRDLRKPNRENTQTQYDNFGNVAPWRSQETNRTQSSKPYYDETDDVRRFPNYGDDDNDDADLHAERMPQPKRKKKKRKRNVVDERTVDENDDSF